MDKHSKSILFLTLGLSVASLTSCDLMKSHLVTPQNVIYQDNVLRWDPVTNADEYKLKINEDEPISLKNSEYRNFIMTEDFKIELQAFNTNGGYYESDVLKMDFHFFESPKNFRQEDGYLKWDEVEGCISYDIFDKTNGDYYTVEGTEFVDYRDNAEHEFYVRANSNYKGQVASKLSSPLTFKSLLAPKNLDYDFNRNGVQFDDVNEASAYEVKVDENVYKVAKLDCFYEYIPEDTDEHLVSVRSISDKSDYASSRFSKPIKLKKLSGITDDEYKIQGQKNRYIHLKFEDKTNLVDFYLIQLNNGAIFQRENEIELDLKDGENIIGVKKVSKKNYYDSTIYLDSDYEPLIAGTFDKVQNVRLSEDEKYVTWDEVPNAKKYVISCRSINKKYTVTENKIEVSKLNLEENYEFYIYATGTRKCDVDSLDHTFIVEKINTPEKLQFGPSGNVYVVEPDITNPEYIFVVNGKEIKTDKNFVCLAYDEADYFEIKAKILPKFEKMNHVVIGSNFSKTYKFKRVEPVKNLRIEDAKICFDGNYPPYYGFNAFNMTTKQVIGSQIQNGLFDRYNKNTTDGCQVGLNVYKDYDRNAVDDTKVYDFPSKIVTIEDPIRLLDTISSIKVTGRTVSWTPVADATKYYVSVNDHIHIVTEPSYQVDISELKESNCIRLYATNDDKNAILSERKEYKFNSKPLKAIEKFYKIYGYDDKKQLILKNPEIANAKYGMYHNGKDYKEVENSVFVPLEKSAIYKYTFFPINDTLEYYFDLENSPTEFYSVVTPELTITNSDNFYTFSWNSVNYIEHYKFTLETYDKTNNNLVDTKTNLFVPKVILTTKELDVSKYYYKVKFQSIVKDSDNPNRWSGFVREYKIGGEQ